MSNFLADPLNPPLAMPSAPRLGFLPNPFVSSRAVSGRQYTVLFDPLQTTPQRHPSVVSVLSVRRVGAPQLRVVLVPGEYDNALPPPSEDGAFATQIAR